MSKLANGSASPDHVTVPTLVVSHLLSFFTNRCLSKDTEYQTEGPKTYQQGSSLLLCYFEYAALILLVLII